LLEIGFDEVAGPNLRFFRAGPFGAAFLSSLLSLSELSFVGQVAALCPTVLHIEHLIIRFVGSAIGFGMGTIPSFDGT